MASDSDVTHETGPHQASYDGFMRFTKIGMVAVALIVALVVFLITR